MARDTAGYIAAGSCASFQLDGDAVFLSITVDSAGWASTIPPAGLHGEAFRLRTNAALLRKAFKRGPGPSSVSLDHTAKLPSRTMATRPEWRAARSLGHVDKFCRESSDRSTRPCSMPGSGES